VRVCVSVCVCVRERLQETCPPQGGFLLGWFPNEEPGGRETLTHSPGGREFTLTHPPLKVPEEERLTLSKSGGRETYSYALSLTLTHSHSLSRTLTHFPSLSNPPLQVNPKNLKNWGCFSGEIISSRLFIWEPPKKETPGGGVGSCEETPPGVSFLGGSQMKSPEERWDRAINRSRY